MRMGKVKQTGVRIPISISRYYFNAEVVSKANLEEVDSQAGSNSEILSKMQYMFQMPRPLTLNEKTISVCIKI